MLRTFKTRKRVLLLLLLTLVGSKEASAQQDKMYSQYMFNMLALNPAYAGSREVLSATGMYRNQWVNVEGAPKTMTLTLDTPLKNEKVGVGVQVYNDKIGIYQETGAFASYAFRIKVGDNSTLALGLQGGAVSFQANYTDVRTGQGDVGDPAFHLRLCPGVGRDGEFQDRRGDDADRGHDSCEPQMFESDDQQRDRARHGEIQQDSGAGADVDAHDGDRGICDEYEYCRGDQFTEPVERRDQ